MAEFWIGSKIGRGPVGTSYEGMLKEGRQPVVVKVVSRRFHEHPELLEGILEELKGWVGFEHNNILRTLRVTTYQDRHAVIFDKATGENLEEYLRERGPLEPRLALLVLRDVALAMSTAHEGDVAIGDVRSAKIYFDGRRAQLADLGMHRAACMGAGFGRYGMAFGHPAYLAPEVLQEGLKDPTPQTDIYALGILFYELLTGSPPYEGEVRELLRAHVEQPLAPPAAIAQNKSMLSLLARLTAKDPQNRLRTAGQLVEGLYKLVGASPPPQQNVSLMSTGVWRRQAIEDARESSSEWSADQIEQAQPVGPNLSSQTGRFSSARLPQALMHSAELPTPAEEPAPQAEGDDVDMLEGAPIDWEKVKLKSQVARGPCGSIYDAELAHFNKPVMVKVLSTKFAKGGAELHRRIMGQVLKSVGMGGAHAAGPVRVATVDQRDLIVFERVEGGKSLRQLLVERTRIPHEQALEWTVQLAKALKQGERRGLAHGDIRPEKVLVDAEGRVRLADFGMAIASCLGAGFGQIGLHFGHPNYLAPEVIQTSQDNPSFLSDVYALGILLYEMVSGYPPFQGDSPKKTLVMHLQTPLPPPPKKARVPRVIAELILQLATKDPTRRVQNADELIEKLQLVQKQVRLSGGAVQEAAPPVEEFDPTSMGMDGTSGMWASDDSDPGEISKDWSPDKIEQAEAIGPDGLDEQMWTSEEFTPDSGFDL